MGSTDEEACGEGQLGEETNVAKGGSHSHGSGVRVYASNGLQGYPLNNPVGKALEKRY